MRQLFLEFPVERLMTPFQLRNMRLHGHGPFLPVSEVNVISVSRETRPVDETSRCIAPFRAYMPGVLRRRPSATILWRSRAMAASRFQVGRWANMTADEERELKAHLERLRQEHRDLDAAIEALRVMPGFDQLQLARFKKRKLQLKDRIGFVEDQILPDIIA